MERAVGYLHDARDQDRVLVDQLDDFRLVRFGVFEELLKRTSDIELVGDPAYSVLGIGNPILMSLGKLPVRLKAA